MAKKRSKRGFLPKLKKAEAAWRDATTANKMEAAFWLAVSIGRCMISGASRRGRGLDSRELVEHAGTGICKRLRQLDEEIALVQIGSRCKDVTQILESACICWAAFIAFDEGYLELETGRGEDEDLERLMADVISSADRVDAGLFPLLDIVPPEGKTNDEIEVWKYWIKQGPREMPEWLE